MDFFAPRPPHRHKGHKKYVLYLDYDGVLHPDDVWRTRGRGIHLGMKSAGHQLFECCQLLESALQPYPEVNIVLSTSWVRVLRFSAAASYLPVPLREKVVGATYHTVMPRHWFENLTRGAQVLGDVSRRQPDAWVAIDDTLEGWTEDSLTHLVPSNSELGLADPAVQAKLAEVLAKNFGALRTVH